MPGLYAYTSDKLEILSQSLSNIIKQPLESALIPEIVIVQSRGMAHRVSMDIAENLGICANIRFIFPNKFIEEIFEKVLLTPQDTLLFKPDWAAFAIMKILPLFIENPEFEPLKKYISDDENGLKLFQLCSKIADVFDQYIFFRPDMIRQWERGKEKEWQPELWQALCADSDFTHRAELKELFGKKISETRSLGKFPQRISVFGISFLPLFHFEILRDIAQFTDVNLFLLNPCREYWFDILSDKAVSALSKKYAKSGLDPEILHLQRENRLLSSLGNMGKEFFSMINEFGINFIEIFDNPERNTLLSQIQADILELTESRKIVPKDMSVQIHSCHSPRREMEVLHDNILNIFEKHPEIEPKDIIIMTPDIETYAPFIQAVFDADNDRTKIPFTIADRSVKQEGEIIEAFLSLLDLKKSRFQAGDVLDLLEISAVREKFAITAANCQLIRKWVEETQIRWGIDDKFRIDAGVPGFPENTWDFGIKRLLAGYAMSETEMFADMLPYNNIEGSESEILGRFLQFVNSLINLYKKINKDRTLLQWSSILWETAENFFILDNADQQANILREIILTLAENQNISGFNQPVPLEIVKAYLDDHFKNRCFGSGFISKGITFCAMVPMRSIPAEVICLVGMNEDIFPADVSRAGFDLIGKFPRRGDISRRNDDKYLFLEALISARKILYISYVGQSIQDNTKIPGCTPVMQLCDYISECFGIIPDQLITEHKLEAHSPEYFKNSGELFSYSRQNFEGAQALFKPKNKPEFFSEPLSPLAKEWKNLNINSLCSFWSNPCRFFLERRLGIFFYDTETIIENREDFNPDNLKRYKTGTQLVEQKLSDHQFNDSFKKHRAAGNLPHGNVGNVVFRKMWDDAEQFAAKIKENTGSEKLCAKEIEINISGFDITGVLTDLYKEGQIRYRYAKARDFLHSWIYHLFLCSAGIEQCEARTLLLCKDTICVFKKIENPEQYLEILIDYFKKGMCCPLKFLPQTSFQYAENLLKKGKNRQQALSAALKRWDSGIYEKGFSESEDPYYRSCFKDTNPIDAEFEEIAVKVFQPILNKMECKKVI